MFLASIFDRLIDGRFDGLDLLVLAVAGAALFIGYAMYRHGELDRDLEHLREQHYEDTDAWAGFGRSGLAPAPDVELERLPDPMALTEQGRIDRAGDYLKRRGLRYINRVHRDGTLDPPMLP